jgi:hypothetical protein
VLAFLPDIIHDKVDAVALYEDVFHANDKGMVHLEEDPLFHMDV